MPHFQRGLVVSYARSRKVGFVVLVTRLYYANVRGHAAGRVSADVVAGGLGRGHVYWRG